MASFRWYVYGMTYMVSFTLSVTALPNSSRQPSQSVVPPVFDHGVDLPTTRPLVLAHRGSSGALPEHTLEAYQLAIEEGADVVECDVCITRDLHAVCLHESWMNSTTNVEAVYPGRNNTYFVPDQARFINDYFSVDFTLSELNELVRKRQRFSFRDQFYNDMFRIASLEELIDLVQNSSRPIGLHLETKDPIFVNSLSFVQDAGTTLEDIVLQTVHSRGYVSQTSPCFLQSFSEASVRYMAARTVLPLVQLINRGGDVSDERLAACAEYAYGIGPDRNHIVRVSEPDNRVTSRTDLVTRAHGFGLRVHPYTLRNEYTYLAWDYGQDPLAEHDEFWIQGVDGIFTDFPRTYARYLDLQYSQCDE